MRLPLNWLEQYVKTNETPYKIAERFTLSGNEVEKIEYMPEELTKVIVGEITEISKHPNADRLQCAVIKIGKNQSTNVVCGASNIKVGQKVPIALPGVQLPNGIKLGVTSIRGVESKGMLCSEVELGLGANHDGIFILDPRMPVGVALPKALSFSNAILNIGVTPNRSDCFSIEGLAREYAALTKRKMIFPKRDPLPKITKKKLFVSIKSKQDCHQYYAVQVDTITNGPSPIWLQTVLREAGIRPINAVVDITNYVMLATGQPMHAYDTKKITDSKKVTTIIVRRAKKDEKFKALDGVTYTLDNSNVVIANQSEAIAIAGVMGGEKYGVENNTTSIIFEAAIFNSITTRKTAQKFGLRSESSSRFERGVYQEGTADALAYALKLTKQLVGGTVSEGVYDVPARSKKAKVVLVSYEHMNAIIGASITKTIIRQLLLSLGFTIKELPHNKARVTVPAWRLDIAGEEDVIEEIVRLYGVNNLKPATMKMDVIVPPEYNERSLESVVKESLIAYGFNEVYLYSFYSDRDRKLDCLSMFCDGRYDHLTIKRPLNPEQKYARKSILPGIVRTLSKNINLLPDEEIRIFEVGNIFIPKKGSLPDELPFLAGGLSFLKNDIEKLLLYTKGIVESIVTRAGVTKPLKLSGLHDRGVLFEIDGEAVGMVYVLSDQALATYKLKKPVALFEVSLSKLQAYVQDVKHYKSFSSFPSVTRDIAVEVDRTILWGDIKRVLKEDTLESIRFLSQYPLSNKKSLAFRLVFRSHDSTLISNKVDMIVLRITTLLEKRFGATIRGHKNNIRV